MSLQRARVCSDAIAAGSQPHTYTILSIATVPPTAPVQALVGDAGCYRRDGDTRKWSDDY